MVTIWEVRPIFHLPSAFLGSSSGLVLLPYIWLCRRFYKARKRLLVVPLGSFILFALSGILWMGGFEEFLYAFGF